MQINDQDKLNMWQFGGREVLAAIIGAALFIVLDVATSFAHIPSLHGVSFHPAAVIPMVFGVIFGPWAGLVTGLAGKIMGDLMTAQGFWPWWGLGYGLMGFLPGLAWLSLRNYRRAGEILKVEGLLMLGAVIGMGLASVSEVWVSQISLAETVKTYFLREFLSNVAAGVVLVPVVMIGYAAILHRKKAP
jgi:energy-coupling factor transport system substrate-specific component